nr:HigA family addiction module antitoxin [Armatimonas sp.]
MTKRIENEYLPDEVFPPGETLTEVLENAGMTQAGLAERSGLSQKHINEIIKGKAELSEETALKLERVLGISAGFWNRLESAYQEYLVRKRDAERLSQQLEWLSPFPLKEMQKWGFVPKCDSQIELAQVTLTFFGIASPEQYQRPTESSHVRFRRQTLYQTNVDAVAVWLRMSERIAEKIRCEPYSAEKLKETLPALRALTLLPPDEFQPKLIALSAQCGVAVAFVPELPGTCLYGAARWLTPTKALVAVSLRGKKDDLFWHTFFHEIGHIYLHGKRELFLDDDKGEGSEEEDEADRFAQNLLIPAPQYRLFTTTRKEFYAEEIERFAAKIGIAPGIVVGRLQHDRLMSWKFNNSLKKTLKWKEPTVK